MGLFGWVKGKVVKHEIEQQLKERPGMNAWLQTHKAPFGVVFTLVGVGLLVCGDDTCGHAAKYFLIVGIVLTSAGVLPADQHAKELELFGKISPAIPAIRAAIPAVQQIAEAVHELLLPALQAHTAETVKQATQATGGAVTVNVATPPATAEPVAVVPTAPNPAG